MNNIQRNCTTPAVPGIAMLWLIPQESVTLSDLYQIENNIDIPPVVDYNGSNKLFFVKGNNKNQNYTETPPETSADNLYNMVVNMSIDDNDEEVVNGLEDYIDRLLFVVFMDMKGKIRLVPNATLSASNASGEDAVGLGSGFTITASLNMPFYFYSGIFQIETDNRLSFT
jgi:hypothetical protein